MNWSRTDNSGRVDGFCLVKSVERKSSVKGDDYLDFTLGDSSGEINGKLWGYVPSEHGEYAAGDVVKVRGTINMYKDAEQLRIEKIRHTMESDAVKAEELVRSAAFGSEEMYGKLIKTVESFADAELKKLVLAIYEDKKKELLYWPAAFKLHHAFRGGLLMHTLSIVKLCESVAEIYPFVNRDLLISGAMLHDIAKLEEFDVNGAGTAEGYSPKGNLLGHIAMGAETVGKYAERLGISEETAVLVKHMILSHHGLPEFGAAVRPMFIEAEILSELDLMDARLFEMREALSPVNTGEFSGKQWALDNVKLYNHGRSELDKEPEIL